MKKLKALILILSFILNSGLHASCQKWTEEVLSGRKTPFGKLNDLELADKIRRIENVTNWFRKRKENPGPAINLQIEKEIALMDSFLLEGRYSVPHRQWRTLFRETELAHILVSKNKKAIMALSGLTEDATEEMVRMELKKGNVDDAYINFIVSNYFGSGPSALKNALQIEMNQRLVKLGKHYQRYKLVRTHLEEMLDGDACDPACKKSVQTLLERMGVGYEKEQLSLKNLINGAVTPGLDELGHMLRSFPLANMTRLLKERNAEIFLTIRSFVLQPDIINKIFNNAINLPGINKSRIVRLFKMIYNEQARVLHFPKINKVVRSTKDARGKFHLMRELNSTVDYDDLLVTFGRRADEGARLDWKAIKEYAQQNEPEFFARMLEAEKKAAARGDISLIHEKSFVARLAGIIFAGGGVAYYYFSENEVAVIENNGATSELPVGVDDRELEEVLDEASQVIDHMEAKEKERTGYRVKVKNRYPAASSVGIFEWLTNVLQFGGQ